MADTADERLPEEMLDEHAGDQGEDEDEALAEWVEGEEGAEGEEEAELEEGEEAVEAVEAVEEAVGGETETGEEPGEDIEASLDDVLRARLAGNHGAEYEEEEEQVGSLVGPEDEQVKPRAGDEFVCHSCFLIKNRSQLADPARMICADCASSR